MKNIKSLLLLLLLIICSFTQRGGGRSSSFSSRSSSSFRSSTTPSHSYYTPSYSSTTYISPGIGYGYGGYGGYGYNSGYYGYSSGISTTTGIILGCIFGVIALVLLITIIYCCCCRNRGQPQAEEVEYQQQQQYDSNQIAQRQAVKQQYFNAQKISRNNVCFTNMSEDQFQFYRNYFQTNKWNFYYNQYNTRHDVVYYGIQMTKIGPFLYSLAIKGTDELGNWTINGFYLNTVKGIQWWGMKNYDHPNYAGQSQQWDKLMYQGAITRDRNYYGRWYFVGFENNPQYSADWFMQTIRT